MLDVIGLVTERLSSVRSFSDFQKWVRFELRTVLPHAAFLGTFGKTYASGSIPTHRIDVDFPLCIIEELKNRDGALDDPTVVGWLQSGRPRFVEIQRIAFEGDSSRWHPVLSKFGMKSMLIHGCLDHDVGRFSIFQLVNPCLGSANDGASIFGSLIGPMSRVAWSLIDDRSSQGNRFVTGRPILALTLTEVKIVEMLAEGLSNKEIARRRGVSESTVKTQVQRTGAKLGATRRAQIVATAMPLFRQLPPQASVDYDGYR